MGLFSFFSFFLLLIFRPWSSSVSSFVFVLRKCGFHSHRRTWAVAYLSYQPTCAQLITFVPRSNTGSNTRRYPFHLSGEGRYRIPVSTTLLLSLAFNSIFPSQDDLHRSAVSRRGSEPSVSSKPSEPAAATARILKYTTPIWRTI